MSDTTELQELQKDVLSKTAIGDSVQAVKDAVISGHLNPLKGIVYLDAIQKIADGARKAIMEDAVAEAEKHDETSGVVDGVQWQLKRSGARYDYSHIPEWQNKKAMLDSIQDRAKRAHEQQLKGSEFIDEDTGEVVVPAKHNPGKLGISLKH